VRNLGLVLCLVMLGACFPSSQDLYDAQPRFKAKPSSILFFRNTRSVFYDWEEKKNTSIELFYPSKPTVDPSQPGYRWFLAYNRTQETAYVFNEASKALEPDPCKQIEWHWNREVDETTLIATRSCPGIYPEENFKFLVQSYSQLDADRVGYLRLASGKLSPLYPTLENKRRFMRLVRDYLELVDVI
jgi:hypothetical protein